MTVTGDRLDEILDLSFVEGHPAAGDDAGEPGRDDATADVMEPSKVLLSCAATFLSVSAAGWMAASIFSGFAPRVIAIAAALYGVGAVALSYRTKRPSSVQYASMAGAALLGAILVIPDATGGSANLPGLVVEAVRNGGIAQPPVPFDPGWKFLLVVIVAVVGIGASAVAVELRRPKLGVVLPVPVIVATLLLQPSSASIAPTVVALLLAVGGLTVAFGADLAREGATSSAFELRRFLRGGGVMVGVVVILGILSQLGFLFPAPRDEEIIPPKRPAPPPPSVDRELFTVESNRPELPLRLGTLDVYDDNAWMTPPFATSRLVNVERDGALRLGLGDPVPGAPVAPVKGSSSAQGEKAIATFRISDVDGRVVPSLANAQVLRRKSDFEVTHDPRTQSLRLDRRAAQGMEYTIEAPVPAGAKDLATAGPAPPSMAEFLKVPPPPREVAELLAQAPSAAFERLQFLRNAFYAQVVAAGAGNPVDVPPARVGEMLSGKDASPFEITAGEALLARWAGVPSRIGYGYFGGEEIAGGRRSIRPVNGSSWLEAYFDGFGWIPIIGTPPKAKSGLNDDDKKKDPTVRPTDELATVVFVPVQGESIVLLFTVVRYWLQKLAPWVMAASLVGWLYPGLLKVVRRSRRRRWAARGGPPHRLAIAYAEWRDMLSDYNIGHHAQTPIELLDAMKPDAEHVELAWLTTRGLWGDLNRDLRDDDAVAAEEMVSSLCRRLRRSQSGLFAVLAFASRASLRDPYNPELPNAWIQLSLRRRLRGIASRLTRPLRHLSPRRLRRPRRLRPAGTLPLMLLVLLLLVGGCVNRVQLSAPPGRSPLPASVVPSDVGGVTFARDEAAEKAYVDAGERSLVEPGQVYNILLGSEAQGTLQIAAFKPGLRDRQREVRAGVLQTFGGSRFKLTKVGGNKIYELRVPEQQMLLWFPDDGTYYELMIVRSSFEQAKTVFAAVLAHQRGDQAVDDLPPPLDRLRGRSE